MSKDELKELILALILFILVLPLIVKEFKSTEKAIAYCMDQGYSYNYCSDIKG